MALKTTGVPLLLKLSLQTHKVTSLMHERRNPNDRDAAWLQLDVPGLILVISMRSAHMQPALTAAYESSGRHLCIITVAKKHQCSPWPQLQAGLLATLTGNIRPSSMQ